MTRPIYIMGKKGRKNTPCGKCHFPIRRNRRYVIDPIDTKIAYHAECYRQLKGKSLA